MIWNNLEVSESAFPTEITPETCLGILLNMYKKYRWDREESKGRNPLVRDQEQLRYYAILMYTWIMSKPLNMMISNMINYYKRKGIIWHRNEYIPFMHTNKEHINWVINDLIADIDNVLRFKIKNYFCNYYLIVAGKNGTDVAGAYWTEYLEYGTTDRVIIDLQNLGFPRHIAMLIKEKFEDVLVYDGNELMNVQFERLLELLQEENHEREREEVLNITGIR